MHVRLFAAAQHLERVAPDALHGGNVHPLAAGVDLREVRAEGHAVEPMKKKKEAYPDYRKAQDEMQELMKAQKNVEMFFAEEKGKI